MREGDFLIDKTKTEKYISRQEIPVRDLSKYLKG